MSFSALPGYNSMGTILHPYEETHETSVRRANHSRPSEDFIFLNYERLFGPLQKHEQGMNTVFNLILCTFCSRIDR
jgi:hypothetical protein